MDEPRNLEEILEHIRQAAHRRGRTLIVGDIFEAVGNRSFAPMLTLVGLLVASPLSGIPLFPTVCAAIILIISTQLLIGRQHIWVPGILFNRAVPASKLNRAIDWLTPGARFVDRFIKARLTVLVMGPGALVIALICLSIAAAMPLMEFIPFSSSIAGVALCAFGLSLLAYDGLLALLAYLMTGTLAGLIVAGLYAG